jgi:hypothetical protein
MAMTAESVLEGIKSQLTGIEPCDLTKAEENILRLIAAYNKQKKKNIACTPKSRAYVGKTKAKIKF